MSDIDLTDYFYYDETSPSCLRWAREIWSGPNHSKKEVSVGDTAGSKRNDGYWMVANKYGRYVHRVIAVLHGHNVIGRVVDHLDGNPSNNKISNLRVGSEQENRQNTRMSRRNSTGVVGVSWMRSKTNADGSSTTYATCSWVEEGTQRYARFSANKFGIMPAFLMAVAHRNAQIERLNAYGAAYTGRHGKRLPA